MRWCALLWLVACAGGEATDPAEETGEPRGFLDGGDQTLPGGVVGEPYEAFAFVDGGIAPYRWQLAEDQRTPGGLVLQSDGRINGIPSEAGEHTFAVIAEDSLGRTKRMFLSVSVRLDPLTVACGETLAGNFAGSALGFRTPDFDQLDSLAWIAVESPGPEVQRVTFDLRVQNAVQLYIQRPSEPVGSWNIDQEYVAYYVNPPISMGTINLDPGTDPSLTGFLTQPSIPLLLVGQGRGTWELTVECSDDPVFERVPQFPTELGTELGIDFDVYGDNSNIRIYTEDPLPEWMEWDEATGEVTGIAQEPGAWEFTVIAEDVDDPTRRRAERSIIGVYEVVPASCDESLVVDNEQSYFEGEFGGYWDPRGYTVHRVDLSKETASAMEFSLVGTDGHYVGIADPDPGWLKFFGGGAIATGASLGAQLTLDPQTYPGIRHYVEDGQVYVIASATSQNGLMQLTIDCDDGPRPDMAAMPVIEPFVEADYQLRTVGGTPPYSYAVTGLPTGLSLRGDRLVGTTATEGTLAVRVNVTDANGVTSPDVLYPLFVGLDEACYDATRIECGDKVDGRFTTSYFADGSGAASTEVLCFVDRTGQSLGWEVSSLGEGELRVDVGYPGADAQDILDFGEAEYVSFVEPLSSEGVAINPFSWPDLDDFQNAAVRVSVRAFNPGDWEVRLECQ